MNRITAKFIDLKEKSKTAFIGYLTAGDPNIEKTEELVLALERGGADIIELGIPYSDPLADGPVIQQAGLRAFEAGITVKKVFDAVKNIRSKTEVPLLFLVYYNTIYSMGCKEFTEMCSKVGIDGLIVPDLPLEERDELKVHTDEKDICLIPLVAPTSKDRVKDICKGSAGFVYCVSAMGVTGMRNEFRKDILEYLDDVKSQTDLPIAVGFGISSNEAARRFAKYADGVIVGSAIVDMVYKIDGDIKAAEEYIKEISNGL